MKGKKKRENSRIAYVSSLSVMSWKSLENFVEKSLTNIGRVIWLTHAKKHNTLGHKSLVVMWCGVVWCGVVCSLSVLILLNPTALSEFISSNTTLSNPP